jgi:hypothetical protein
MLKHQKSGICFKLIEYTKVLCKDNKLSQHLYSTGLLVGTTTTSRTLRTLTQKDDEIHNVLERYAQYHPDACQILQILPIKKETRPEVWLCTTNTGRNNSLESIMC